MPRLLFALRELVSCPDPMHPFTRRVGSGHETMGEREKSGLGTRLDLKWPYKLNYVMFMTS